MAFAAGCYDVADPELAYGLRLVNALYMKKLYALRQAAELLGLRKGKFPTLTDPEERGAFMAQMRRNAARATLPANVSACRLLLDLVCPKWMDEEPGLLGSSAVRPSQENWFWRATVLKRDGHICRACGTGRRLHAHHIVPWAISVEGRLDISNGVTLCVACHKKQHRNMRSQIWQ